MFEGHGSAFPIRGLFPRPLMPAPPCVGCPPYAWTTMRGLPPHACTTSPCLDRQPISAMLHNLTLGLRLVELRMVMCIVMCVVICASLCAWPWASSWASPCISPEHLSRAYLPGISPERYMHVSCCRCTGSISRSIATVRSDRRPATPFAIRLPSPVDAGRFGLQAHIRCIWALVSVGIGTHVGPSGLSRLDHGLKHGHLSHVRLTSKKAGIKKH